MAFIQYLRFGDEKIPQPLTYDLSLSSIEADSGGETEAGTTQRDIVRNGVVSISVSFCVTATWLKRLSYYAKQDRIRVFFFDTYELKEREAEMFITGFKASIQKDTSGKGIWKVSFDLKEF